MDLEATSGSMNGIPKRWALWFFAFAVTMTMLAKCYGASDYEAAFRVVMCPLDWHATVAQRYDDRDRFDWIVKRTWIKRCY